MASDLPEHLDPIRFCDQKAALQGSIKLSKFNNLKPLLASDDEAVEVVLNFSRDSEKRAVIRTHYCGVLNLICQRCLQDYAKEFDIEAQLAVIETLEQAHDLPDELDPLLFQGELVSTKDMIEEELLLLIPMVPRCDRQGCKDQYPHEEVEMTPQEDTHRPFSGLDILIKKQE